MRCGKIGGWGLALALAGALSPAGADDDVQVVRAYFDDPAALERVTPLLGHAQVDRAKGVLRSESDRWLRSQLIAAGLRVEIDAEATVATQRSLRSNGPLAIPGYACYRTVEEAQARILQLATQHPTLATVIDIGQSWLASQGTGGYPLRVLKLGNSNLPGPKPVLFLVGSIHAREYTPAELVLRFAEELVAGYGTDADATWILDHHEVHVLVHANPDGRKRAEGGLLWRKNANNGYCPNTNTRGADLNRNFPFVWGEYNGSSPVACDDTYRGPTPGSEPETQAIVDHLRDIYADLRGPALTDAASVDAPGIFIDIHSYSQLVLWPWGFVTTPAPNATALQVLGRRLAGFNNYTAQAAVGLYPTDGTTGDFAYGELGVASYAMELGSAFFESCAAFENQVLPVNRNALRYAARTLRAPYRLPAGPDASGASVNPDLVLAGDEATLQVTLDDARQQTSNASNSGPVPAVQAIAGARAWLQVPPWQAGASPLELQPVDGSFNTSVELARGTLDTGALATGRHLVFVQGRDVAGSEGVYSAAFVDVVAPEQAATLSGNVTDIGTGAPLQAEIRVGDWRTQSAADGGYARLLRAGSWPLSVTVPGYERETEASLVVAAGAALTRDFALYRLCPRLSDPVDTTGTSPLVAQTPWQRRGGTGQDGGAAWLQSALGNYANNLNASLTSAVLDLSGYTTTTLAFDQHCETEAGWDYGIVEVSNNGGSSWSEVFRCSGESAWRRVELALPQLDGDLDARLRFRFTSDTNTTARGWAVDAITLSAGGAACRAGQQPRVAIGSFAAAPAQIARGAGTQLAWSTRRATACTLTNSVGDPVEALAAGELASGMRNVYPLLDARYTLRCDGPAGPAIANFDVNVLQPVAIQSLAATPAQIVRGQSTQLAWSTQHATACTLSRGSGPDDVLGAGELASGTRTVSPLEDARYSLRCEGSTGPVTAAVDVDVLQPVAILTLGATPTQIERGASTQIAWTTQNADACTLGDDQNGPDVVLGAGELAAGNRNVMPLVATRYTLDCTGVAGPATQHVGVEVLQPPVAIAQFAVQPAQISTGESATLSWTTQHATGCTVVAMSAAPETIAPAELDNGQRVVSPTQDTTWTLQCEGRDGPVSAQATLGVTSIPDDVFADGFESLFTP